MTLGRPRRRQESPGPRCLHPAADASEACVETGAGAPGETSIFRKAGVLATEGTIRAADRFALPPAVLVARAAPARAVSLAFDVKAALPEPPGRNVGYVGYRRTDGNPTLGAGGANEAIRGARVGSRFTGAAGGECRAFARVYEQIELRSASAGGCKANSRKPEDRCGSHVVDVARRIVPVAPSPAVTTGPW